MASSISPAARTAPPRGVRPGPHERPGGIHPVRAGRPQDLPFPAVPGELRDRVHRVPAAAVGAAPSRARPACGPFSSRARSLPDASLTEGIPQSRIRAPAPVPPVPGETSPALAGSGREAPCAAPRGHASWHTAEPAAQAGAGTGDNWDAPATT